MDYRIEKLDAFKVGVSKNDTVKILWQNFLDFSCTQSCVLEILKL